MDRKTRFTVLVVEDIEEIALQMERALLKRNHKVIRAANAQEAMQIAEQALPAMILTDPDLPTLNALLELISEHRYLKDIPVVIIDIDEQQLDQARIKVLGDFEAFDNFAASYLSRS